MASTAAASTAPSEAEAHTSPTRSGSTPSWASTRWRRACRRWALMLPSTKWQAPGWQPTTRTPSAPSRSARMTISGSTRLLHITRSGRTFGAHFRRVMPATSAAR